MKICVRCGAKFNRLDNFKRHLNKKIECKTNFINIPRDEIINRYDELYHEYLTQVIITKSLKVSNKDTQHPSSNSVQNVSNSIQVVSSGIQIVSDKIQEENIDTQNLLPNNSELLCPYCGKEFKHKCNYYRHKKNRCKFRKEQNEQEIYKKDILELTDAQNNLLKLEYEKKIKEIINQKEEDNNKLKEDNQKFKQELQDKIKELEDKIEKQDAIKQIQKNINSNVHNDYSNNINIYINDYGKEKTLKIPLNECEKIAAAEFNMILKFIEYSHFATEENRNIYFPSLKQKYGFILKEQDWNIVDKKPFMNKLIIDSTIALQQIIDKYGNQFTNISKERVQQVLNFCGYDQDECKRILTEVGYLLSQNSDIVKKTYEQKYNKKMKSF